MVNHQSWILNFFHQMFSCCLKVFSYFFFLNNNIGIFVYFDLNWKIIPRRKKCRKFTGVAPKDVKTDVLPRKWFPSSERRQIVLFFDEKLYFQNSRLVVDMWRTGWNTVWISTSNLLTCFGPRYWTRYSSVVKLAEEFVVA